MTLDRIRLRFADPEIERAFRQDYARQTVAVIRLALVVGIVVYGLFGLLDYIVAPDHYGTLWLIRFGFVIPVVTAIYFYTYSRHFPRFGEPVFAVGMAVVGTGIVAMTAVLPEPVNGHYYAGLILVLIYCSTLVRLSYQLVIAIAVTLVVLYEVVAVSINPVPPETLIGNNFFLISASAMAILIAYLHEYYIRRNYRHTRMLVDEKVRSVELMMEARAANRAKTQFLANMSHELRTPLNAIIGFSEVMRDQMFGPLGSERYQSYADDIFQSGSFLLQIINDILDLSRAEVGQLTLNETSFDMVATIDQCLRLFRDQAAGAGIRLSVRDLPHEVRVHGDERLLRQALANVISNAIKFTQKGGAVTIDVAQEADRSIEINIVDTGTGIAPDEIDLVTQPFVQLANAYTREHAGAGLGLPLAKRTLELHGGDLRIDSRPGIGTTVTLTLPAERIRTSHRLSA